MKKIYISLGLLPLIYAGVFFAQSSDPIKFLYSVSGFSAIGFLFSSLISPKEKPLLGIIAYLYASLHVLIFFTLDLLSLSELLEALRTKPFIIIGFLSYAIMFYLLVVKKHFHLVYLALLLGTCRFTSEF